MGLQTNKCLRCGHEWVARTKKPVKCPNQKCQSPYWNKEKKEK